MPRGQTFKAVEAIGRTLSDVEVTTTWGKPTLKVRGNLKEHYLNYPCVVVRLSRIIPHALRDLVIGAHRYVSARGNAAGARARPQRSSGG
jgi:hypothetical protein